MAGTEIINNTRYLTLTFRSGAQTQELAVELQTATAPNGPWESVAPSVTEVLGYDALTGDPIVRLKLAVAPEDLRRFVRLKVTGDEP